MKSEQTSISSSQMIFLITSFIQAGVLPLPYSTELTGHSTWLVLLTALAVSLFFTLLYVTLARFFPDKNLLQINDIIYGPYLGKLISILYLFFFLSVIAANLWLMGSFWTTYLMPETPRAVFIIVFIFICIWAVRKGIEVIARCSTVTTVVLYFLTLLIVALLFKDMKFTNFLPILDLPLKDFIQSTHIMIAIPFCEIVVFIMIFPQINNIKQLKSSVMTAVVLGAVYLLILSLRDTAVLGNLVQISNSPSFITVRQVDIGHVLTRLETVVAIGIMLSVFTKITVFFYAAVFGIAQLIKQRSYLPLVTPIGIIAIILGLIIFRSDMEQVYYGSNIWPFYVIPFEFLFPVISLVIAQVRGLPKKMRGQM